MDGTQYSDHIRYATTKSAHCRYRLHFPHSAVTRLHNFTFILSIDHWTICKHTMKCANVPDHF